MPETLPINPTRMELLKQRSRLVAARRAHDLLEDKRDELMQRFLPLVRKIKKERQEAEESLRMSFTSFQIAKLISGEKEIEESLMWTKIKTGIEVRGFTLLKTPQFTLKSEGNLLCYGFYGSNWKLEHSLRAFSKTLSLWIKLAQKEEELKRLAREIEWIRRRVNALKYIFIPRIEETVKYIAMKLQERERAHIVNIMKIKEIMQKS
ncbi:V-type ATP synthase subunit D [Candidatus Aerophobetes bacterium]|nr:V-type ATP synthase subunit D [Candidatus Aerophobetes bacterium]